MVKCVHTFETCMLLLVFGHVKHDKPAWPGYYKGGKTALSVQTAACGGECGRVKIQPRVLNTEHTLFRVSRGGAVRRDARVYQTVRAHIHAKAVVAFRERMLYRHAGCSGLARARRGGRGRRVNIDSRDGAVGSLQRVTRR